MNSFQAYGAGKIKKIITQLGLSRQKKPGGIKNVAEIRKKKKQT
jgi:hypothetical protein